ncbi:polyketide synthase [Penicillium longicatenatum]|nr:polyketide synthase [Penicillium longicatenatum]
MFMQGTLDLDRLGWAFNQALQRHDAFRTCFITDPADESRLLQSVMKSPAVGFEIIKVADRAAAERCCKDLESYEYNVFEGTTLKLVNYSWSSTDHLLVFAYHRLVGDGWTTEHLFVEAGRLYNGVQLDPPPSYADFAVRQRNDLVSGAAENDLSYWSTLFETLPVRLPMLDVPGKRISASPTWSEHETSARVNPMIAVRIKDRSRKHKTIPMHFYLAAFHVLLARLTTCTDVAIGVADTNRSTLTDQATMGFFASLLPVRLRYSPDDIFAETLIAVKDEMRGLSCTALYHSQSPLFQAVFDYKQGQAETGSIGRANIVESHLSRAGSPYDITLEMSDDPNKDPLIILKLQSERYAPSDADVVMDAYLAILSIFFQKPRTQGRGRPSGPRNQGESLSNG